MLICKRDRYISRGLRNGGPHDMIAHVSEKQAAGTRRFIGISFCFSVLGGVTGLFEAM